MKRHLLILAFAAAYGMAASAEEISSGLQVGQKTPAFSILDITGPQKGKTLCYV